MGASLLPLQFLLLALAARLSHYPAERNHQGLGNKLIAANEEDFLGNEPIRRQARLGSLLSYYYREAA
jgi:hypothetical protein